MDSSAMHAWIHSVVAGGIVAGVAAAIVLVLVRIMIGVGVVGLVLYLTRSWHSVLSRNARRELWVTLKLPAYPFVGDRALEPGFDSRVVWLAVVILFGFSICMGLLFAVLARHRSFKVTVGLGILFGVAMWIFDLLLINPSPAVAIEALPSGLAMAFAFWWHERHLPTPR